MGNLNEIQKQTTQSYGDNSFTTTIKENTVEFDSTKDSFTFNDEVNVPSLKVNGQEITPTEPQVQSDWEQNDSAAVDYIKNRTHYIQWVDNIGEQITVGPDGNSTAVTIPVAVGPDGGMYVYFDQVTPFVVGETYRIKIGDVVAEITTVGAPDNSIGGGQSDVKYGGVGFGWDINGLPEAPNNETARLKFGGDPSLYAGKNIVLYRPEYVPLDERYIPDTIARANQVAQADWNQSDSASQDFVKNRPFYEDIAGELVVSESPVNGAIYFDWGEIVPVVGKRYYIEWGTDNDGDGIIEQGTEVGIAKQDTQYSPEGVIIGFSQGVVFYTPDSFSAEGHNVNGRFSGNPNVRNLRLTDTILQKIDAKFIDGYMTAGTGVNSNKFNAVAINVASGEYSHAECYQTTASGASSHAEGGATTASGDYSHAEGGGTAASGDHSHAEGGGTKAIGFGSHAEGGATTATGDYSHAEGNGTKATHSSQHVVGEYNIADPSTNQATARGNYVEIVGNGTNITRSNARTLDWSGNEMLAGTLTIGGASGATLKVESGALKVSFNGGTTWLTVSAS